MILKMNLRWWKGREDIILRTSDLDDYVRQTLCKICLLTKLIRN